MATFDVIFIGGGPAGYVGAIRCAQLGLSTAVIEREGLGGTCVLWGCIPAKSLLESASMATKVRHAAEHGITLGEITLDFAPAMKRSRGVSQQNSKGVEFLFKKNKITWIKGEARLAGKCGGLTGAEISRAEIGGSSVRLRVDVAGKTTDLEAEKVLVAAGRAPNVENIGLEEAGVQVTERGFVKVNERLETTAKGGGIYAIGDVAGPPMLAHKGQREGIVVAELIAGQHPHLVNYGNIPNATY